MRRARHETYLPYSIVGRKFLWRSLPALLAVVALTVAAGAPAGARTPKIKKPGAPTEVRAAPINGGTTVSWAAPLSDGGSPITGYSATIGKTDGCTTSGALTCTISGLKNGKTYFVKVRASNAIGLGKDVRVTVLAGQGPDCSNFSPGADLQYCKLKNANLTGVDLTGANLFDASLFDANLQGADLADASLVGADLNYANLADTDLSGTVFDTSDPSLADFMTSGGVVGTPSVFPPSWGLVDGYLVGPVANLTGADLAGANLSGFNLLDVNLTGANLSGANLSGVAWSNTTCPDGTNSNSDGDTCVNNLA
jgi:uncharacterized protein YjbI with pentapeptide repeats